MFFFVIKNKLVMVDVFQDASSLIPTLISSGETVRRQISQQGDRQEEE